MDKINDANPDSFDCFLCYNDSDKREASKLARDLSSRDISVWWEEESSRPGELRMKAIGEAITTSSSIAVLVGRARFGPWEEQQIYAALNDAAAKGRPVIPVLLNSAAIAPELPSFLESRTWVDLRKKAQSDDMSPLDRLIWAIKGERATRFTPVNEYPSGDLDRLAERLISTLDHKEHHGPILKQIKNTAPLVTAIVTACHDHQPSLIAQHLLIRFIAERKNQLYVDDHPFSLELPNEGWIDAEEFEALLIEHFGKQAKTLDDVAQRIDQHFDGQCVLYVPIDSKDQFWWMLPHRIAAACSVLAKLQVLLDERRKLDIHPCRLVVLFSYLVETGFPLPWLGRTRPCKASRYWTSLLALGLRLSTRNCVWANSTRMIEARDFEFWPLPWLNAVIEPEVRGALDHFKRSLNTDPERYHPEPWDSTWQGRLFDHLKADLARHRRSCQNP